MKEAAARNPIAIPISQLKEMATSLAGEFRSGTPLTPESRRRFIDLRSSLFLRGIYDPVLVRFDSATAPRATNEELAEQLESVAGEFG